MPYATPDLRRLRLRAGVKSGPWAERVKVNGNHYVNVEGGHKPGSRELFARCARALSDLLGEPVEADQLIAEKGGGRDLPRPRNSTAGGTTAEATETAEAAEAEAPAEADVRGVA